MRPAKQIKRVKHYIVVAMLVAVIVVLVVVALVQVPSRRVKQTQPKIYFYDHELAKRTKKKTNEVPELSELSEQQGRRMYVWFPETK